MFTYTIKSSRALHGWRAAIKFPSAIMHRGAKVGRLYWFSGISWFPILVACIAFAWAALVFVIWKRRFFIVKLVTCDSLEIIFCVGSNKTIVAIRCITNKPNMCRVIINRFAGVLLVSPTRYHFTSFYHLSKYQASRLCRNGKKEDVPCSDENRNLLLCFISPSFISNMSTRGGLSMCLLQDIQDMKLHLIL